jgi:hypothetical protein
MYSLFRIAALGCQSRVTGPFRVQSIHLFELTEGTTHAHTHTQINAHLHSSIISHLSMSMADTETKINVQFLGFVTYDITKLNSFELFGLDNFLQSYLCTVSQLL